MNGLPYSVDVERIVREFVLKYLPCEDPAARVELESKTAHELLFIWFNWRQRFITVRPRTVHVSNVLANNPIGAVRKYKHAFRSLKRSIESGANVNPHLSRDVDIGYQSAAPLESRADLDLMLNEWRIHHLHLSTAVREDGFVKRTVPLLFAVFQSEDAFLIDIAPHGKNHETIWASRHLLEIVVNEWPDAGIVREMPGVLGLENEPSEREHLDMRNIGIGRPFLRFNGKFYFAGSGFTSAGTSAGATLQGNSLMRALRSFAETVRKDPMYVPNGIRTTRPDIPLPTSFAFDLISRDNEYLVLERNSKIAFHLGYREQFAGTPRKTP